MARTTQAIQNSIITNVNGNIPQLTSTSQVAIWKLWTEIIAIALNNEEILTDQFIAASETSISSNPPANLPWIQRYALAFQYSSTSPQTIQINLTTLIPGYPTINTSLQIITRCAIVAPSLSASGAVIGTPGEVLVKVATGATPAPLTSPQLSAFQTYMNIIAPAGLIYKAISVAADLLMCQVNIFYQGGYASIIKNNVYTAYLNYISSIPFNGIIKVSDLEGILRNVAGVNDVEFISINYRQTGSTLTSPYNVINNYTQLLKDTTNLGLAGYAIDETTTGFDFLTLNANNFFTS